MTLPTNIILPLRKEQILSQKPEELVEYLKELIFKLQNMYEDIALTVNGDIFSNAFSPNERWIPVMANTGGSPITFDYTHQIGWALRQGLITDCWFDIEWSNPSGSPSGNMYIELPYQVAQSSEKPFSGVCQPSVFAFSGGTECVLNAIPDTYRCEVWNTGDGFTTANQGSVAAGQLIGHVRYIGKEIET